MKKIIFLSFWVGILSSCVSTRDYSRAYFSQGSKVKGVEPAESVVVRMRENKQLQDIIYGPTKSREILQCTLLRNQLYVAALTSGGNSDELKKLTIDMEQAYQLDNENFLTACKQIASTDLGRIYLAAQQEYLSRL